MVQLKKSLVGRPSSISEMPPDDQGRGRRTSLTLPSTIAKVNPPVLDNPYQYLYEIFMDRLAAV